MSGVSIFSRCLARRENTETVEETIERAVGYEDPCGSWEENRKLEQWGDLFADRYGQVDQQYKWRGLSPILGEFSC